MSDNFENQLILIWKHAHICMNTNLHLYIVSEIDPQKIGKGGSGGSVHCTRYEGARPIGF